MQRYKRLAAIATAAMGLTVAGVAQAQENIGGYVGGSVGQTDTDDGNLDSSTGFRIYGGYMFNPNFGVELGYLDAGEFDGKGAFSASSVEANGAYIAGVGTFPLNERFSLFGKAGLFHYEYDVLVNGNTTENNDGTEMILGFGVDYSLTPVVTVGAEYNQVSDIDEADVDAFWLNVRIDMDGQ